MFCSERLNVKKKIIFKTFKFIIIIKYLNYYLEIRAYFHFWRIKWMYYRLQN